MLDIQCCTTERCQKYRDNEHLISINEGLLQCLSLFYSVSLTCLCLFYSVSVSLLQVSRKGGRSHERKFYLFNDMLMYAKPKLLENGDCAAYSCCCVLPLHHCRVSRVLGCGQGEGALFTVGAQCGKAG